MALIADTRHPGGPDGVTGPPHDARQIQDTQRERIEVDGRHGVGKIDVHGVDSVERVANGFDLSVAVAVGFIALAGVAAEIGVLVLTFIDHAVGSMRREAGRALSAEELRKAALEGTAERVRPIAMTAAAIIAGLLPIFWGQGTGSDIMQRIALPMVGGMVTTTILCLLVLPVIYSFVLEAKERRSATAATRDG